MPNFQMIVIYLGITLLLIALILIGYTFYTNKVTEQWPPIIGDCPDYWVDTSGNGGNCVNTHNLGNGTCSAKTMNFSVAPYIGSTGLCAEYKWATACGITWDGITSTVPSPCDPSYNSSSSSSSSS